MSMDLMDITSKLVAIVHFGPAGFPTDGTAPGRYFQVTIDPACTSPSGQYIRFGHNDGDEIQGWQRCEAMTLIEVLGYWGEDGSKPTLKYGDAGKLSMPMLAISEK
jgi:hypothetical protein